MSTQTSDKPKLIFTDTMQPYATQPYSTPTYATSIPTYYNSVKVEKPNMSLFEVAIIEFDNLGKATGQFEVANILAPDIEAAKFKAAKASSLPTKPDNTVSLRVRSF